MRLFGMTSDALIRDDINSPFHIHGCFQCIAIKLAVTLRRMCVSEIEQRAGVRHPKIDGCSLPVSLKSMFPP